MTTPNSGPGSRRGSGGGGNSAVAGGTKTPVRGGAGSTEASQRGSPSLNAAYSCLRWAECPQNLLDDPEGVLLLKQFMEDMNPSHARAFDFYFAVKGLKSGCQLEGLDNPRKLVRLINKKYVSREDCVPISAATRAAIQARVRSGDADPGLFDPALDEIVQFLTHTVYPAFLKSDLYINYVACVGSGSAWQPYLASGPELAASPAGHTPRSLPTVHEDRELQQQLTAAASAAASTAAPGSGGPGSRAGSVPRSRSSPSPAAAAGVVAAVSSASASAAPVLDLTIKNLYATRFQRGRASLPEFAGGPQSGMSQAALPYHTSYAPGSKQDSELQSLSSDALTDDTVSHADTSSSFEQQQLSRRGHQRAIRRSADINKEDPRAAIIPRPATAAAGGPSRPAGCDAASNPVEFARQLAEKLQAVQRDLGRTERLAEAIGRPERPTGAGVLNSEWAQRLLARNSGGAEPHNPEQILDNHLETVFDRAGPAGAVGHQASRSDTEHVHHYHYHHHYGEQSGSGVAAGCRQSKSTSSLADSGVGTVSSRGRSRQSASQHRQHTLPPAPPPLPPTVPPQLPTSLSMPAPPMSVPGPPPPQPLTAAPSLAPGFASGGSVGVSQRQLNLHVAQQAAQAGPRQPFACDPNMPLMDKPLTDNVIVEASRRLEKISVSSAQEPVTGPEQQQQQQQQQGQLTIGYFLFGEPVPFRCTWPGREITLGQFKQLIAKKGSFRYFFKKRSDEFVVGGAVHEEVTDDSELLPLWEGKVVGKVEKIE
ncbi:hypothetical protein BOX15_Mlig022218g1 [Macrostomum lignano]|uniref:Axin-1 n=2 Tax=Macrostomum lignano TaxID=282301 RepID=A0A267GI97_9PLAT|nr:hypothetical protein BOX15_Mlig022218g1 [Macrostomum lignano]